MNKAKFIPWTTQGSIENQYRFKNSRIFERSISIDLIHPNPQHINNVDAAINKLEAQQWVENEGVINAVDPQYTQYCLN